ncbi:MAG: uncharacterized protein KVP18_003494 [Porospora cf. gigantea A]|uniref:uncharacterized protein n=1 Tax=Porospora cf. gigantea A TaxID=2853593 RepID=UPI00355A1ECA|nr:MAG: hypothetical protein KVP18_003494 [Porospora cf. gigantea A]
MIINLVDSNLTCAYLFGSAALTVTNVTDSLTKWKPNIFKLRTDAKLVLVASDAELPRGVTTGGDKVEVLHIPLESQRLNRLLEGQSMKNSDDMNVVRTKLGPVAKTFCPTASDKDSMSEWQFASTSSGHLINDWGPILVTRKDSKIRVTLLQDYAGKSVRNLSKIQFGTLLKMAEQLAMALKELRTRGVIHEDIKPDNLAYDKKKFRIIDFDLSRTLEEIGLTAPGTAAFCAPEKAFSDRHCVFSCFASDIWSLGCSLASTICPDVETLMDHTFNEYCKYKLPGATRRPLVDLGRRPAQICKLVETAIKKLVGTGTGGCFGGGVHNQEVAISQFVGMLRDMLRLDPQERITPEEIILRVQEIRSNLKSKGEPVVIRAPLWNGSEAEEHDPDYRTMRNSVLMADLMASNGYSRDENPWCVYV